MKTEDEASASPKKLFSALALSELEELKEFKASDEETKKKLRIAGRLAAEVAFNRMTQMPSETEELILDAIVTNLAYARKSEQVRLVQTTLDSVLNKTASFIGTLISKSIEKALD